MTTPNSINQNSTNNSSAVKAANPSEMGTRKTITSLEIAEEAERNHKDVMRSVREMEPAWVQVNGRKFALVDYIDKKGEARPCYQFTYEEFMYVISKFDDITRAKLVTRWAKIETGQAAPMYVKAEAEKSKSFSLKDMMSAASWAAKFLNLNDSTKLLMAQQILAPTGLNLPDYTPSKGVLKSASVLLTENSSSFSVIEFNNKMIERGYLESLTRTSSKGKIKIFKHITKKGLKWGENYVNPKSPQQTQPLYYIEKFPDLLKELLVD